MNKRIILIVGLLMALSVLVSACVTPTSTTDEPQVVVVTATPDPAAAAAEPAAPAAAPSDESLLQVIKDRGELICGVNNTLRGFGYLDTDGSFSGFDVDFCKAVAAAVLGDAEAVQYRPLTAAERFTAVQTGEVDVLFRNTTWTLQRDGSNVGMEFMPTTFYDGQGMMVRGALNAETLEDLDGATICVQSGTTTELNLADNFRALGIDFEPVVFEDSAQALSAYDEGRCDGYTTDKSGLVSQRLDLTDPTEHVIMDVTMSKEPLAGAVRQGDPAWADAVRWVVFGLIEAEEYGVTSSNIDEMMGSEDPTVQRLLGVSGDMGEQLGLDSDFMVRALQATGNFAEIYDRNLGPDTPFDLPRGLNKLYSEGGLLYSPPFR
ncbi:MAG: amino acid ABC transporter substrate-binding protein [Caldilineaceae bacterium]|nr:amino acid ABC transporter substrate-binding protein [Caldilineaceae bacterium]